MSYEEYLPELVTGFAGTFSGWIFARRKNRIQADSNEIDNLDKAVALWREIAQDLKAVIDDKQKMEDELRAEISELRARIKILEAK